MKSIEPFTLKAQNFPMAFQSFQYPTNHLQNIKKKLQTCCEKLPNVSFSTSAKRVVGVYYQEDQRPFTLHWPVNTNGFGSPGIFIHFGKPG